MVLKTLDIAIGLVFLYLLLTFLASALLEFVASALSWRAKVLYDSICQMLEQSDLLKVVDVYAHPLVASLSHDKGSFSWMDLLERSGWRPKDTEDSAPSYIPASIFSAVLLDELQKKANADATPEGLIKGIAELPEVKTGKDALAATIRTSLATQGASIQAVRLAIEKWFNDAMDRATGWYKRRTQTALLLIGLVMAFGGNIDSIAVSQWLWQDDTARQAVVAAATKYVNENQRPATQRSTDSNEKTKDELDKIAQQITDVSKKITDLQYPIGKAVSQGWPQFLVGAFLTAIAISMGSTFWFDALQNLIKIRGAGPKPGPR